MNISLDGSSHPFLFRRSEELDSQLFPKRVSFKTYTTTFKEVEQKNLVPWLSTLYIFIVITRVSAIFSYRTCYHVSIQFGYNNFPQGKARKLRFLLRVGYTSVAIYPGSSPSVCWLRISLSIFDALPAMVTTLHLFGPRLQSCCLPSRYHGSSTSTLSIAS